MSSQGVIAARGRNRFRRGTKLSCRIPLGECHFVAAPVLVNDIVAAAKAGGVLPAVMIAQQVQTATPRAPPTVNAEYGTSVKLAHGSDARPAN
jgi:hypothetical protein